MGAFVNGKEVDINMILPTSSHVTEARSDLDDNAQTMFTHTDAPGLLSGRMEWSEVAEKRARIIALQNEVVTKNLTSTSTVTSTAATTATFSVTLASCTTSGFTFGVPLCTASTG